VRQLPDVCKRSPGGQVSAEDIAQIKHEEELADLDYLQANIPASILSTIDGVGASPRSFTR
jgi:hypothetical protein